MKARIMTGIVVVALTCLALPAAAQNRHDRRLADEIGRAVSAYGRLTIFDDVNGTVEDDTLRYRIARAIYGNPSFWNYAARAHPPIHIIVERGRVRLTGVVNSNVERMLARSLATGLGELSVANELLTDAEVRVTMRID